MATYPDYNEMVAYARQSAQARGIDPDLAIRALKTEGLSPNTWQSNYRKNGVREPSYGPGQLLVGGAGTGYPVGLGNEFIKKYGKHPQDPSTWRENLDFTFDNVAKDGWGAWYGPAKIGITGKMGVDGTPGPMAEAMMLGPTGGFDGQPGPQPVSQGPMGPGEQIQRSLLGIGAGLSSINNPAGAQVAMGMLNRLNAASPASGKGLTAWQQYQIARDEQDRVDDAIKAEGAETAKRDEIGYREDVKLATEAIKQNDKTVKTGRNNLNRLAILGRYADNPAVIQKKGGEILKDLKGFAQAWGWNVEGVSESEAFDSLAKQFALSVRSPSDGEGMPGHLSDRDLAFLQATVPSLNKTPEANKMIINYMSAIEQQKVKYATEANKWLRKNRSGVDRNGVTLDEYMEEWRNRPENDVLKHIEGYEATLGLSLEEVDARWDAWDANQGNAPAQGDPLGIL